MQYHYNTCNNYVCLISLQRVPGPGTYNTSTSVFGEPKPLPAISHHFKKKTGIAMS